VLKSMNVVMEVEDNVVNFIIIIMSRDSYNIGCFLVWSSRQLIIWQSTYLTLLFIYSQYM